VDLHSLMTRNEGRILTSVAGVGGEAVKEHPKDPGKHPFPSIWPTAWWMRIQLICKMVLIHFPQCMFGAPTRKDTTLAATPGAAERLRDFEVRCVHSVHEGGQLCGKDEQGRFRTRKSQAYPPAMCALLALAFVEAFMRRPPLSGTFETYGQTREEEEEEETDMVPGEKVRAPEMGPEWDPVERWREVGRWRWKHEEHNNILEGRAGIATLNHLAMDEEVVGKRVLIFTDNQVVLGVMAKGRSSVRLLNFLARKAAALTIGLGMKVYWRYVRTHRNHADGPSRGCPLGVAPGSEKPVSGLRNVLPDSFYKLTKG